MPGLRSLVIVLAIVLACPAFGVFFGSIMLGPGGDAVGGFAGLVAGLCLTLRYLADMRAIAVAYRNTDEFIYRNDAKGESGKIGRNSVRAYLRSPSWRTASLRKLVSDQRPDREFDPNVRHYHSRLSDFDKRQAYDLQMPREMGKRKGKPKRQRWT